MSHPPADFPTVSALLRAAGPLDCQGITLTIRSEISEVAFSGLFFAYEGELEPFREGTDFCVLRITGDAELSDVLSVLDEHKLTWDLELTLARGATPGTLASLTPKAQADARAEFPPELWRADVAQGDTQLGYEDWLEHNVADRAAGSSDPA